MAKELKSILTKYLDICVICGRPREELHHIFGNVANRPLSDADNLICPLCRAHHNESGMSVHYNKEMKVMSHIIGELAWERQMLADQIAQIESCAGTKKTEDDVIDEVKDMFRKRYGQNFL